jgi:Holliday junction resolvase RusA-like endonuclease
LEANAFGDLLPGVLSDGVSTHEAEARAVIPTAAVCCGRKFIGNPWFSIKEGVQCTPSIWVMRTDGMALLLEFTVEGPPVSHQTSNSGNLKAWQAAVKSEATKGWSSPPLKGRLKFLVLNFYEGDKPPLDDDNMVKPIRDALNKVVYDDDRQIRHSETIQLSIDAPVMIRGASQVLLSAFSKGKEFLYVRIEDAVDVIQLPR